MEAANSNDASGQTQEPCPGLKSALDCALNVQKVQKSLDKEISSTGMPQHPRVIRSTAPCG